MFLLQNPVINVTGTTTTTTTTLPKQQPHQSQQQQQQQQQKTYQFHQMKTKTETSCFNNCDNLPKVNVLSFMKDERGKKINKKITKTRLFGKKCQQQKNTLKRRCK